MIQITPLKYIKNYLSMIGKKDQAKVSHKTEIIGSRRWSFGCGDT